MMDVTSEISAVRRELGSRTLEAGQARVLTISRSYPGEMADVFDAVTNPERIPRWFLPITGDLVEGGRYQLEGNAGGEITRCDAPHGFDATWEMGPEISWIELRLAADGVDRTLLTLTHIAHVNDEMWAQFGPGAVGIGWDSMLLGLSLHLGSGASMGPAEAAAWMVTDEAKRFFTESSEAWYAANVAYGTDAATARAMADGSTAAYTGAPAPQ
jgi:uncharacterized protein YndB with AHSA1/START domain